MSKKMGWDDVPDSTKDGSYDSCLDLIKLEEGEWKQLRLLGDIVRVRVAWMPVLKKTGGKTNYPILSRLNVSDKCPLAEAGIRISDVFISNVIDRDEQEDKPENKKKLIQPDKEYREVGDKNWSPIRVIRLPLGAANKVKNLGLLNKVKTKDGVKVMPLNHPKFGRDILIMFDNSQTGSGKYDVQREDRTPLTEEELAYLQFDLEKVFDFVPDETFILNKMKRAYDDGLFDDDDDFDVKRVKKVLKSFVSEDDEDDEDEDETPKKSKGKSKKAPKKSKVDEDDEDIDLDDLDDDDLEEEEAPKKKGKKAAPKKGKKSRVDEEDDEEDEFDEDDDDDLEEEEPPKKKSKKVPPKKSKKVDDDDDDDDDDDLDEDDDDDLDEDDDLEEEEPPKKKGKKAPVKKSASKKGKKVDDDLDDDDDEDEEEKPAKKSKGKKAPTKKSKKKVVEEDDDDDDDDLDDDLEDDLDDDDIPF